MMKIAKATRTGANTYDVTYPAASDCDRDVPWSYLEGLRAKGFTVEVDQTNHRGEGEPAKHVFQPTEI